MVDRKRCLRRRFIVYGVNVQRPESRNGLQRFNRRGSYNVYADRQLLKAFEIGQLGQAGASDVGLRNVERLQ